MKTKLLTSTIVKCSLWLAYSSIAAIYGSPPSTFWEVYNAIKEIKSLVLIEKVEEAALEGICNRLWPEVQMLNVDKTLEEVVPLVRMVDQSILQIHLPLIEKGTFNELLKSVKTFSTNSIEGIVLDLRFSKGWNYNEGSLINYLFTGKVSRLVDWQKDLDSLSLQTIPLYTNIPVVVLINQITSGAAEALVLSMKEHWKTIIIGEPSAGELLKFYETNISNGQLLRIATERLVVESEKLRVLPDIKTEIPIDEQMAYIKDPYTPIGELSYLKDQKPIQRPSEADIAQLFRERVVAPQNISVEKNQSFSSKLIIDPMLSRAVDILKIMKFLKPIEISTKETPTAIRKDKTN